MTSICAGPFFGQNLLFYFSSTILASNSFDCDKQYEEQNNVRSNLPIPHSNEMGKTSF